MALQLEPLWSCDDDTIAVGKRIALPLPWGTPVDTAAVLLKPSGPGTLHVVGRTSAATLLGACLIGWRGAGLGRQAGWRAEDALSAACAPLADSAGSDGRPPSCSPCPPTALQ